MEIVIAIISILGITGVFWLLNHYSGVGVCPICAGVSGTWLWVLAGIYVGLLEAGSWSPVAAIAMGGSVVGIAYQVEKRLPSNRSPFLWKALFIPAGFVAVYSVISYWWSVFAITTIFLIIFWLFFSRERGNHAGHGNKTVEVLREKMKDCC